jgi:hypothetical protein
MFTLTIPLATMVNATLLSQRGYRTTWRRPSDIDHYRDIKTYSERREEGPNDGDNNPSLQGSDIINGGCEE